MQLAIILEYIGGILLQSEMYKASWGLCPYFSCAYYGFKPQDI